MKNNANLRKVANASLALLISASHVVGAMEGDGQKEVSSGLPSRNNYETILREIEELTTRIHREVDQVLADYKRDTAEYHRRMGIIKGTTTMMLETQEQEIARGQIEQHSGEVEKIKAEMLKLEEQRKVEEFLLEEQLRAEARRQAEQRRAEIEKIKEEMQRQEQQRKAEEALRLGACRNEL